tara:strand:+ start:2486 stop:4120 length:1635 start_codon:yes stop_codon:yes gene_type:complete
MNIIKSNLYFFLILILGLIVRLFYLINYSGELNIPNLGGDPCHHFNSALNVSNFFIPKNDFIFAYWFRHENLPALIDIYPPGFYLILGIFLFIFGDTYFLARIFNLLIGLLNIFFAYLIGIKLKSKTLGVLSALSVAINIFHIENSVILMNVVFSMLAIQIVILSYLFSKNWFLIGICNGFAYLSYSASNVIIILIIVFLIYDYYSRIISIKNLFKNILLLLLGFIIIIFPWLVINYQYFGSILYSHQNFYPFTASFSNMMHETSPPSISEYLNLNFNLKLINNYFTWFIKDIFQSSLFLTPTLFFFLSILFYPLLILSFILGEKKIKLLFLIFFSIFGLNVIGSNANYGVLWPRHYIPVLSLSSILVFYGFLNLIEKNNINKYFVKNSYYPFFSKLFNNFYIVGISILIINLSTIIGLIYKDTYVDKSFWNKETSHFYNFGKWINQNTENSDRIMYALTPQDAWCASGRMIIGDPTFRLSEDPLRAKQEIEYYDVKYLWIDLSSHIYERNDNIENVIKLYENINLKLIKKDDLNKYYFYEIIK